MAQSIRVRLATTDDAEAIAAIYAPIVTTTAISFEERPPDRDEMQRRIATGSGTFPWLVSECDDVIAGYAYAGAHRTRAAYRWSADVTVYVAERARRRGVARTLYGALLRTLAGQGYYSAFAGVALPNEASVALHHSIGFVDVGTYPNVGYKFGAWRDVLWLARPLRLPASSPQEPRALADFTADEIASFLASG